MKNKWQKHFVAANENKTNPNAPVTNYEKANEDARKPDAGSPIDTDLEKVYANKLKIDPVTGKEEQEEDRPYGYNP
ncbi:hypothetical protein [Legionella waltersii]|uniref:Uncharacterized protein n=1 Tax=Legionella waltersii TaxID=66969 RepID=A0A0W1A2J0_9GAMM|nr:hypothetical protein [Legionella waltersii]KTD75602.1 hypothetical protein Lwal_2540 [Legionella waltersii]SNU98964.1 Uncharacterised protein [Legionella waltersii]